MLPLVDFDFNYCILKRDETTFISGRSWQTIDEAVTSCHKD